MNDKFNTVFQMVDDFIVNGLLDEWNVVWGVSIFRLHWLWVGRL